MRKEEIPFGEIGYICYKRTYARRLNENDINSKTEEFEDTVDREVDAAERQLGVGFTQKEQDEYKKLRLQLKFSVAGRFMWQLGTKTVTKLGLPSLQNCAGVLIDQPIRPFTWAMEMLMLGCGVGYTVQREYVYQLPKLKKKIKIERLDESSADFIVPDTREGWVKLLGKVLKAHFYSGEGFTYSTELVRSKGAVIRGFGGTSSGPEELCWGMGEIHKLLNNRSNQKLRPIDCLDIMNIIGYIVVSGNVRRSAQICIGDFDDLDYLKAKRWDLGYIPNWRAMSNNSIATPKDLKSLPQEFWDTYQQGEPYGFINFDLMRSCGRLGETQYPDPNVVSINPCGEIPLDNYETCCLGELYLPNIETYEELLRCIMFSYRMCKHSLNLHCSLKETEDVVHKNMRLGIGVTGYLQATEEQRSWLSDAYVWLRDYDKKYSAKNEFPVSIKLTTIKPSGTLSLLPGVTPGVHPNPAGPYYIRRMRISADSALVRVCKQNGYHVEPQKQFDGTDDRTTMVVEFPCKVPETTPVASNFTWKQQIDNVIRLQREWSDNAVSCTVYYRKEDLPELKAYLEENLYDNIKTISFLLQSDHGFKQAPYETITKERYLELVKGTTRITSVDIKENEFEIEECLNGSCPIK